MPDFANQTAPRPTPSAIPTPGTPAYWTVQREAVALVAAWDEILPFGDPAEELAALDRIASHGFAVRMMQAHGLRVRQLVREAENVIIQRQHLDEMRDDALDLSDGACN